MLSAQGMDACHSGEEVGGRQGEGSHEDSVGPAKTPERMVKTNIMKVEKNVIEIRQVILCVAHVCMCVRMCRGQGKLLEDSSLSQCEWVLGIELRSLGFVADIFIC